MQKQMQPLASPQPQLPALSFEGRSAFRAALKQSVLQACAADCRELYGWDPDFIDWPWSEPEVLAALTQWARPGRCLHLLALQYEGLRLAQPRFAQWRATWGHCVQARACASEIEALASALGPASGAVSGAEAALFFASTPGFRSRRASGAQTKVEAFALCLRLYERQSWRGSVSTQWQDLMRGAANFDVLAQRSSESFASRTLGL